MANLIAVTYPDPETAKKAMERVDWADFDGQVNVLDACWMANDGGEVIVNPEGHPVVERAALYGAMGLMIGALFAIPVAGLAAGAAMGGYRGKQKGQHFDDEFAESIKSIVAQGGSAIVVLYEEGADTERAGADLAQLGGTVHSTTISNEELAGIQAALDRSDANR
jgi:uncharacterized membrane protein